MHQASNQREEGRKKMKATYSFETSMDFQHGVIPQKIELFKYGLPALGSTQPLTEMSTRNLPGGKKQPARRADNLAAICEPNV
jgi:hypothetical protein